MGDDYECIVVKKNAYMNLRTYSSYNKHNHLAIPFIPHLFTRVFHKFIEATVPNKLQETKKN